MQNPPNKVLQLTANPLRGLSTAGLGCPRIALLIPRIFDIDEKVVKRSLSRHNRAPPRERGPSGLSFIAHTKDSLWSVDIFDAA